MWLKWRHQNLTMSQIKLFHIRKYLELWKNRSPFEWKSSVVSEDQRFLLQKVSQGFSVGIRAAELVWGSLFSGSSVELEISWQPIHPISSGAFMWMWADYRSTAHNSSLSSAVTMTSWHVANMMVCSFVCSFVSTTFFSSIILILGLCWSFGCGTFFLVWTFLEIPSWVTDWALWLWCFCSSVVSNLWHTERNTLFLWSGLSPRICW